MTRKETLISRGLNDPKIISDLIEKEKNLNLKPNGIYKFEMYDRVNYMCRHYMDRIARVVIDYDSGFDLEAYKKVIICFFEMAPLMHSKFVDNHIIPYWKSCHYSIDEVITVFEKGYSQDDEDAFLLQDISLKSNVQFKIGVFVRANGVRISYVYNHMIMDGGGVKTALDDISRNYNELISNGKSPIDFRVGSRSYKRVYDDFSDIDKKRAKRLFKNVSSKCRYVLPFDEKCAEDRKMCIKRTLKDKDLINLKSACKKHGVSVNDAFVAAYISSVYEILKLDKDKKISVSNAVDLRKYMSDPTKIGYTNHVTFFPCVVEGRGESFDDLLNRVNQANKEMKNDEFLGLHGLPLLNIGYSTMIYAQAELVVKMFYNNANLAVSNVGFVKAENFTLGNSVPTEMLIVGAAKKKPCAVATVVTMNNIMNFTFCSECNDRDYEMLSNFADLIREKLLEIS